MEVVRRILLGTSGPPFSWITLRSNYCYTCCRSELTYLTRFFRNRSEREDVSCWTHFPSFGDHLRIRVLFTLRDYRPGRQLVQCSYSEVERMLQGLFAFRDLT